MLDVLEPREHGGRRLGAEAGQAGIAVRGVADEREVVGDRRGRDAELLAHAVGVADFAALPIDLHDAAGNDALREVFVGRPDADFLDTRIRRRERRGRGESIVGFELDHRPDHDAHRRQRLLERVELRPQRGVDAGPGLVAVPQLVAERLDDVVRGHADVRRPGLDHLQNHLQHAPHCPERRIALLHPADAVEVAKELIGAVDEVDDHRSCSPRAEIIRLLCDLAKRPLNRARELYADEVRLWVEIILA